MKSSEFDFNFAQACASAKSVDEFERMIAVAELREQLNRSVCVREETHIANPLQSELDETRARLKSALVVIAVYNVLLAAAALSMWWL